MRYDHSPLHTASFYGFLPRGEKAKIEQKKTMTKINALKKSSVMHHRGLSFEDTLEDRASLIEQFLNKKFVSFPQPIMVYHAKGYGHLSLDVLGNQKSISDAISIETAYAILSDEYKKEELILELNSLGDRDSIARFNREAQNFYRKHWNQVPKDSKALIKKDIWNAYDEKNKELEELQAISPKSMGSLSETSRAHFKEVLEYIEAMGIPYIINHNLIGSPSWMSETLMRISLLNERAMPSKVLACGGRYNSLAKKIFGKKEIPSFGVELVLNSPLKEGAKINYKLFFIQLSFEAKLKSLQIMELLRKSNIPIYQNLSKDKITSQIALAEKMKMPYILLMGKKEAIEDSVVVRNAATRSQETVPIKDLVPYLKKIL